MKAVVQRVRAARVTVDGECCAEIGPGLLVLLGVARGDTERETAWMARKLARLRVFEDEQGRMNRSALDGRAPILVVSQFTLLADCRRGHRPGFAGAAPPDEAEEHYERLLQILREEGLPVAAGRFGAHMLVDLQNDGPVTLVLERTAGG